MYHRPWNIRRRDAANPRKEENQIMMTFAEDDDDTQTCIRLLCFLAFFGG